MEIILKTALLLIIILGPLFHFLAYGSEIFGLPKYSAIIYIAAMVLGFAVWNPLLLITSGVAWGIIVINWGMLIWGMIRSE